MFMCLNMIYIYIYLNKNIHKYAWIQHIYIYLYLFIHIGTYSYTQLDFNCVLFVFFSEVGRCGLPCPCEEDALPLPSLGIEFTVLGGLMEWLWECG